MASDVDQPQSPLSASYGSALSLDIPTPTSAVMLGKTKKSASSISVRIDTYRGINAFERKPFSCYEKIKMVLMTITGIVIVKIVLFIIIGLLLYIFSLPVTLCNKDLQKPLSCWRYFKILHFLQFLCPKQKQIQK